MDQTNLGIGVPRPGGSSGSTNTNDGVNRSRSTTARDVNSIGHAGMNRGASAESAVTHFSEDFENRMRNSIRDELSVVLEKVLDERDMAATFVPSAKGIDHKVAKAAGLCQTSFHRQMDQRLDKFQRQISELSVRVSSQECESKSFASNVHVGQHTSKLVEVEKNLVDLERKLNASLESRLSQEQTERMSLHKQMAARIQTCESNAGSRDIAPPNLKGEFLDHVKKAPEFRRVVSDQVRISKDQSRIGERIAQIENKFGNIAILEGHADVMSGRLSQLARDFEEKIAEMSVKYDHLCGKLRHDLDGHILGTQTDIGKLKARVTTNESVGADLQESVKNIENLQSNFGVKLDGVAKDLQDLEPVKREVKRLEEIVDRNQLKGDDQFTKVKNTLVKVAKELEEKTCELSTKSASLKEHYKNLNRTVADVHHRMNEYSDHGRVFENALHNVRQELASAVKKTKLDLADFRAGTASVLKTVRSRLQTDIDDDEEEEDGGKHVKKVADPVHLGERPSPSPSPEVEEMVHTLNKEASRNRGRSFQTRKSSHPMVVPATVHEEEPGERLPEELPDKSIPAPSPDRGRQFSPPKLVSQPGPGFTRPPKVQQPGDRSGFAEGLHAMLEGGQSMTNLDDDNNVRRTATNVPARTILKSPQPAESKPVDLMTRAIPAQSASINQQASVPHPQQSNTSAQSAQGPVVLNDRSVEPQPSLSDWDASSIATQSQGVPLTGRDSISLPPKNPSEAPPPSRFNVKHISSNRSVSDWDASSAGQFTPRERETPAVHQSEIAGNINELAGGRPSLAASAMSDWDASSRGGPSYTGQPPQTQAEGSRFAAGSITISDWDASSHAPSLPKTPMASHVPPVAGLQSAQQQPSPSPTRQFSDWDMSSAPNSSRGHQTPRDDSRAGSRRQSQTAAVVEESEDELLAAFDPTSPISNHGDQSGRNRNPNHGYI